MNNGPCRKAFIAGFIVVAIVNALARLWGDWLMFWAVLAVQAHSVFGGIYPYLFNKKMLVLMYGPDADPVRGSPDDDIKMVRAILFGAHLTVYLLALLFEAR